MWRCGLWRRGYWGWVLHPVADFLRICMGCCEFVCIPRAKLPVRSIGTLCVHTGSQIGRVLRGDYRRKDPRNTIETGDLAVDSKQAKYLGTLLADETKRS